MAPGGFLIKSARSFGYAVFDGRLRVSTAFMKLFRSGLSPALRVAPRGVLPAAMLLGAILLCLPACSTISTLSQGRTWFLSGTRENVSAFAVSQGENPFAGLRQCIAILDFPFSLALDAVLIPVTLPVEIFNSGASESKAAPNPEGEGSKIED